MSPELKEKLKKVGAKEVHHVNDIGKKPLNEILAEHKEIAKKTKAAKKPKIDKKPRPASGESILIELLLAKLMTREELRDETGLGESSIKMYTGGYLEKMKKRPLRIVKHDGDKFSLIKIEEAQIGKAN